MSGLASARRSPDARPVRTCLCLFSLVLGLAGCASFPRVLTYQRTPSPAMRGVWMEYAVLAPEDLRDDERLPLVLFLHGGGDGPDCWDRAGLGALVREGMANGSIPRAVIVIPEGDLGFWANWYDGTRRYEDWAVLELLPDAQRRYHTASCPEGCHVMGVSMGADGATRFVIHHPELFSSLTSISGPALDTDRRIAFVNDPLFSMIIPTYHVFGPPTPRSRVERDDPYLRWTSPASIGALRIFLAWGSQDRAEVRDGSMHLRAHLDEHAIPHFATEYEGRHAWVDWNAVIVQALNHQLTPAP